MNNDNVMKKGKVIVGSTLRDKLKAKLKEMIRKQMKEISTSGAAGGSPADGSAGPIKTPHAFGKVKDPTTGLDGYKQVGKNETGTINEKEGKKSEKSEKEPKKEPEPYKPIVAEPTKAEKEISDHERRLKKLKDLEAGLTQAKDVISQFRKTREKLVKTPKKSD